MSKPYLYLDVKADVIQGDRDALVTLRGLVNDALRRGSAEEAFSDEHGDDFVLLVKREGA